MNIPCNSVFSGLHTDDELSLILAGHWNPPTRATPSTVHNLRGGRGREGSEGGGRGRREEEREEEREGVRRRGREGGCLKGQQHYNIYSLSSLYWVECSSIY